MTHDDTSAALAHQESLEECQSLLTVEAFDKWLYKNKTICNGDMLIEAYENPTTQLEYFADMGLPADSEIQGL